MPNWLDGLLKSPTVPILTPEQKAMLEAKAQDEQSKRSFLQKLFSGTMESGTGLVTGALGLSDFKTGSREPYDVGNALGQIVGQAGLPFAAYKSILPKGKLFHGTQIEFPKFNPKFNDTSDTLGWMTHFAEDPKYAA